MKLSSLNRFDAVKLVNSLVSREIVRLRPSCLETMLMPLVMHGVAHS